MSKKKISKASKRRLSFFGPMCIIFIIYFAISFAYNIYNIYILNIEKKELENKYVELQEETDKLKTDIEKLNDEEYLANYARENYLYSKDGEYIIHIEDDTLNDNINTLQNDNIKIYILCVISIIFLFIIIYIFKKIKRKK